MTNSGHQCKVEEIEKNYNFLVQSTLDMIAALGQLFREIMNCLCTTSFGSPNTDFFAK